MSAATKRIADRAQLLRCSARWDRMRARAPRLLFVGATVILSLLGARELVAPTETSPTAAVGASVDHRAEDLAQRFARAYLNFDPARPGARERRLRGLVPDELELEAGAVVRASQRVLWTQIAQNQEAIADGRVIVVAAGVSTRTEPVYLAVPVFRDDVGAVGLAGYPALVGPPSLSAEALADREQADDRQVVSVARRAVANYLAAETRDLAADLAPGARVSPPAAELRVLSVDEVAWASGEGSSAVLVTVVARDGDGSEWTLTYEVGIDRGGARPYVTFIETVPNAP